MTQRRSSSQESQESEPVLHTLQMERHLVTSIVQINHTIHSRFIYETGNSLLQLLAFSVSNYSFTFKDAGLVAMECIQMTVDSASYNAYFAFRYKTQQEQAMFDIKFKKANKFWCETQHEIQH